ncbi:putative tail biosynthetic protein [Synechococcus phage Ssp-JY38]|nr:DNA circularization protein [Synechococcus phage Yong-L2-223]
MATGCYIPAYLPGSFNGVPFVATDVTSEHGRRGAEGEFPFGENTAYADLGRRIRTYNISARFQENNHILEAAALIAACELPGPGVLVHPTRGVLNVACRSLKVNDKIENEQGVTYVEMEFVEGNVWPNGLSLIGQFLGLALGTIIGAARTSFNERYQPSSVQQHRRAQVVQTEQDAIGQIRVQYEGVVSGTPAQDELTTWRAIADMREVEGDDTLAADTEIADRALALSMNAVALQSSGTTQYQAFRELANWAATPVALPGAAGESVDAVLSTMRTIAAAYMAEAATEIPPATMTEAFMRLDAITTILEGEEEVAYARCDNPLFLAIREFKVQVQTLLYAQAYNSPRLIEYNFNGAVHPLVAAYAIFGDAKRHRELERSNIIGDQGRFTTAVLGASA